MSFGHLQGMAFCGQAKLPGLANLGSTRSCAPRQLSQAETMLGKPLQAQEAALQQERQRAQQMQQECQSKEAEHLRKQREAVRQWNECADRCAF